MKTIAKKPAAKTVAPALTHDELVEARDRLFELKEVQNEAREEELKIREYLAKNLHDGVEGSKTVTIDGVKVTITRNLNRTIDAAEAEKLSKEHSDVALAVLRWKPEIKISAYKEHAAVMDEYITTRPGPPTVTFK